MRYGYFMMPMHLPGSDLGVTLQTDLAQIERLDELGFGQAWVGEHFTAEWENIPAPDTFHRRGPPAHAQHPARHGCEPRPRLSRLLLPLSRLTAAVESSPGCA